MILRISFHDKQNRKMHSTMVRLRDTGEHLTYECDSCGSGDFIVMVEDDEKLQPRKDGDVMVPRVT